MKDMAFPIANRSFHFQEGQNLENFFPMSYRQALEARQEAIWKNLGSGQPRRSCGGVVFDDPEQLYEKVLSNGHEGTLLTRLSRSKLVSTNV